MKRIVTLLSLMYACFMPFFVQAQIPANDDCAGAIDLDLTTCATMPVSTTKGATLSNPRPTSQVYTNYANLPDVWFKFTASSSSHRIQITNLIKNAANSASSFNLGLAVLADCSQPITSIVCNMETNQNFSTTPENFTFDAYGLTPGNVYYIYAFGTSVDFTICATANATSAAPSNDNCAGAISLPAPDVGTGCGTPIDGTTIGATVTSPDPNYYTQLYRPDVWYKFTATSTRHVIRVTGFQYPSGAATYNSAEVYVNSGCPNLSSFQGSNSAYSSFPTGSMPIYTNNPLTIGQEYYVRVGATSADFKICNEAVNWTPQPTNSTRATALLLTGANNCHNGTTLGSTLGFVYYKFVAEKTSHVLTITGAKTQDNEFKYDFNAELTELNNTISPQSIYMTNFTYPYTGNFSKTLTGLTIGSTYIIKAPSYTSGAELYRTFGICVDLAPVSNGTGNVAVFNGTSNSIESAEGQSGDGTTGGMNLNLKSFTMETWIKFNNPATGTNDWIAEVGSTDYGVSTWFWFNNDNTYGFGYNKLHIGFGGASGGTNNSGDFTYNFTPTPGTWYHLACTYDATGKYFNLYVNGVRQTSTANPSNAVTANGWLNTSTNSTFPSFVARPKLTLGKRIYGGANSHFLDGSMEEFRLWNVAKTQSQIQAQYQTELSGNEPNLVAYYKFDETASPLCSAMDCSPNRFDANNGGTTRTASTVPGLTDMACGADPSVSGVNEFIGRNNGACPNNWQDDPNWSLGHKPTTGETVLIRHGRIALVNNSQVITVNNLTVDGADAGVMNGDAPRLDITNNFVWKSGTMSTYFRTFGANSSIEDTRIAKKYYNCGWDNNGTTAWSAALCMDNCSIGNYGTFNLTIPYGEYGAVSMITPEGGSVRDFYNNTGTVSVLSGSGYLEGSHFYNNNGGTVKLAGPYFSIDNLINSGTLNLGNNVNATLGIGGTSALNSSTILVGSGGTFNMYGNITLNYAFNPGANKIRISSNPNTAGLFGLGSITTNNSVEYRAGRLAVPLTINAGGILNMMPYSYPQSDRVVAAPIFNNNGTINWTGNNTKFENGLISNGGMFNINLTTAGTMTAISGINSFMNCGTLNNQSNTTINFPIEACPIPGRSILKGVGTFKVSGTLPVDIARLGNSPGTLTVDAPIASTPTAIYEMEVTGGYGAAGIADDADKLISTGNIALAGTLQIILYNAQAGSYTLIDGVTTTGNFTSVQYSLNGGPFTPSPPVGTSLAFDPAQGTVTLTLAVALSAELTSFKGKITDNGNLLTWQSASEVNLDNFDVERSTDGLQFDKIGTIKAQGKAATYDFLDKKRPLPIGSGQVRITTYYRLKINDLDQKSAYSKVITLAPKTKGLIAKAYPNPVHDVLTVEIEVEKKSDLTIELRDILGRLVWASNALYTEGSLLLPIPLTGVANGNYFLKVSNGLTTIQQKIVKN